MHINGKRLMVATLIELAVRTKSKVSVAGTKRGFKELTPTMYSEATLNVKNELSARGMLDV